MRVLARVVLLVLSVVLPSTRVSAQEGSSPPKIEIELHAEKTWFDVTEAMEVSLVIRNQSDRDLEVPRYVQLGKHALCVELHREGDESHSPAIARSGPRDQEVFARYEPSLHPDLPEIVREQCFEVPTIEAGGVGVVTLRLDRIARFNRGFGEKFELGVSLRYRIERSIEGPTDWRLVFPSVLDHGPDWMIVGTKRLCLGVHRFDAERHAPAIEALIGKRLERREHRGESELSTSLNPDWLGMYASMTSAEKRAELLSRYPDAPVSEHLRFAIAWLDQFSPMLRIHSFPRAEEVIALVEELGMNSSGARFLWSAAQPAWVLRHASQERFDYFQSLVQALICRYPNSASSWRAHAQGWVAVADQGFLGADSEQKLPLQGHAEPPMIELEVHAESEWYSPGRGIELSVVIYNRSNSAIEVPHDIELHPGELRLVLKEHDSASDESVEVYGQWGESWIQSRLEPRYVGGPGGMMRRHIMLDGVFEWRTIESGSVGLIEVDLSRVPRSNIKLGVEYQLHASLIHRWTRSEKHGHWQLVLPSGAAYQPDFHWRSIQALPITIGVEEYPTQGVVEGVELVDGSAVSTDACETMRDLPSELHHGHIRMSTMSVSEDAARRFIDAYPESSVAEYLRERLFWRALSALRPMYGSLDLNQLIAAWASAELTFQSDDGLGRMIEIWKGRRGENAEQHAIFCGLVKELMLRYPHSGTAWEARARGWVKMAGDPYVETKYFRRFSSR